MYTIAKTRNLGLRSSRLSSPFSALLAASPPAPPSSFLVLLRRPSLFLAVLRDCLTLASPPSASAFVLIFPATGHRSDPLVVQPVKTHLFQPRGSACRCLCPTTHGVVSKRNIFHVQNHPLLHHSNARGNLILCSVYVELYTLVCCCVLHLLVALIRFSLLA